MVASFITSNLNRIRKTYSVSTTISFMLHTRWHSGDSHSHHHDHYDLRTRKDGERIFRLGLAADIGLAASKAFTGYVCGSIAIIADAAHSISDVDMVNFETLGALGISSVLLATAGGIVWHALDVLLGLWSAAPEVADQSMTHLLVHEQHHHGIDMGGSILGVRILDPLAGLLVAVMITKAGLETGYQSVLELVDAAIPLHILEPFKRTILQVDGVRGCSHLRRRRAGSYLYLDVIVEVDPFFSVSTAHEMRENGSREIQRLHPEIAEDFVHIEPSTIHIPPTVVFQHRSASTMDADIKNIVCNIYLQTFLRDAVKVAEEAEKLIIEAGTKYCSCVHSATPRATYGRFLPLIDGEQKSER